MSAPKEKGRDIVAELTAVEQRLRLIQTAEADVQTWDDNVMRRAQAVADAKASLKAAQVDREASIAELRAIVQGRPVQASLFDAEGQPLGKDRARQADRAAPAASAPAAPPQEDAPANAKPAVDREGWRSVPIGHATDARFGDTCLRAGLETLGDLAEWCHNHDLQDLSGVGPARAKVVEELLAEYWEKHPEWCKGSNAAKPVESAEVVRVYCIVTGELAEGTAEELAAAGWTGVVRMSETIAGATHSGRSPEANRRAAEAIGRRNTPKGAGTGAEPPTAASEERAGAAATSEPPQGGSAAKTPKAGRSRAVRSEPLAAALPPPPPFTEEEGADGAGDDAPAEDHTGKGAVTRLDDADDESGVDPAPEEVGEPVKAEDVEIGKTYVVKHLRIGEFVAKVTGRAGGFIECTMVDPGDAAKMTPSSRKGDSVQVRGGLCEFREVFDAAQ